MNIQGFLTKKIGPLPVAVYLLAAVAGGWYLWKRHQAGQGEGLNGEDTSGGSDVSGPISSPDSGTFKGTDSLTVNGDTASMSSAGALLTGGFVGQPGGYQFAPPAGDVFVNVPTPRQVTNVITQQNPDKDRPPSGSTHKAKGTHPKNKKDDNKKKVKKKTVHKSSKSSKGNSGGGVSVNLNN